ncbi:MAG: hypothetical protein OXI94_06650 [Gemmatimonadota bacterium]|nr:hypothetical protein [Gemmatimonadota bacterium]MDE2830439.1 hypothetical protein [Gemmatimonadota bacterium]
MKNIDEFSVEEIGEEWLRELYKVVALRRGTMFRMITETARLLLFGNAGGAALIIGFMSASTTGGEDPAYHYASLLTLLMFAVGTLASAVAMIMVAVVSVKEAHGAETALKRFVDGEIDRTQVMFTVEEQTFRLANYATASGVVSAVGFLLGGLSSIILLIIFF